MFTEKSRPGNTFKTASVLFGGQDIIYGQEDFTGGAYTAIFGGLTINMRSVRLVGDVVINVTAVFGSVDLIVPDNVQLVSNVIPILGGVDNKYASSRDATAPRIIVNGNTVFGGLENQITKEEGLARSRSPQSPFELSEKSGQFVPDRRPRGI